MERIDARREAPERVAERVADLVVHGGTVVFPTDTVYGIGCDPMQALTVERIYALKDRPRSKPLVLHMATVAELLEYVGDNALARRLAAAFLPGPLTLIVARPRFVAAAVAAGLPSIGLRVPDHELCRELLERSGPLAATSANISGAPAFTGVGPETGLPEADLLVDDGPTPLLTESTVIDLAGAVPRIIREGALTAAMLAPYLAWATGA